MKRIITFFFLLYCGTAFPQTVGTAPTAYKVSQIIPPSHAQSGCNWTTGLRTGGAACYDDGAYVNSVLATGTAANPVTLMIDVSFATSVPIAITPYDNIEGQGSMLTGIFVLSGSNTTALCSAYLVSLRICGGDLAAGPAPPTAGSVSLSHFGINGNRGTFPNGNSNSGDGRCNGAVVGWCNGVHVANLKYFLMDDVFIFDSPTYGTLTNNVDRQVYRNVIVTTPNLSNSNTDGIHIDGPFGTFEIDGFYCATGDDCIAANVAEGYGGSGGGGTISNVIYAGALSGFRTYCGAYTLGPVTESNLFGFLSNPGGVDSPTLLRLGYNTPGATDCIQSVKVTNADIVVTHNNQDGAFVSVQDNVGDLELNNVRWNGPASAKPWLGFTLAAKVSNYVCTECTIYRSTAGNSAALWGVVPSGASIGRMEMNGAAIVNEQGQSYPAINYGWDVQTGGSIGSFVMTSVDPSLTTSLLNGNEWSRIAGFYGAGVPNYFRNTVYANLPPASFAGLSASISDSASGGVWGTAETGGSPGHYAQLTSNGVNWTVTGK